MDGHPQQPQLRVSQVLDANVRVPDVAGFVVASRAVMILSVHRAMVVKKVPDKSEIGG